MRLPSLPPLYIGRSHLQRGGAAAKGGLAPQVRCGAPTPRVSNPRRRGRSMRGTPAHQGLVPLPLQPMGPSAIGGPTRWTPGTLPVVLVQYRLPLETFPMAQTGLPIYKSSPPDHSRAPRDVRDLIRDSEQLSGYRMLISQQEICQLVTLTIGQGHCFQFVTFL